MISHNARSDIESGGLVKQQEHLGWKDFDSVLDLFGDQYFAQGFCPGNELPMTTLPPEARPAHCIYSKQ